MFSDKETFWLATSILAAIVTTGFVLLRRSYCRTEFTVFQFALYVLTTVVAKLLWRVDIRGTLPTKRGQGAIVVCNHIGPFDPSFMGLGHGRVVHWMVAKEYCTLKPIAWFFKAVESIPTSRAGTDTAATKLAIRYAQRGDMVGLFPEGRINETDRFLLPGRPGVALIALRARVPVIPCYISGSPYDGTLYGFLFTPAHTRLVIGRPIDISEYYDRARDRGVQRELTKRFLVEIAKLAGVEDFQPELAGRRWKPDVALSANIAG